MTAPLHRRAFTKRPQSFGRRAVSIAELRARAIRRAANIEAALDLVRFIILPLALGFGINHLGGL